jgi:hypothetical protein
MLPTSFARPLYPFEQRLFDDVAPEGSPKRIILKELVSAIMSDASERWQSRATQSGREAVILITVM